MHNKNSNFYQQSYVYDVVFSLIRSFSLTFGVCVCALEYEAITVYLLASRDLPQLFALFLLPDFPISMRLNGNSSDFFSL